MRAVLSFTGTSLVLEFTAPHSYGLVHYGIGGASQVHVFRGLGGDGTPLLALHTTGSMCDVTVSVAKGDHGDNGANDSPAALVAAVGLQHHQNQGMLGGHAVAIRVPY